MNTKCKTPIRCALYLRVSLDATGEHLAVTRQREDCVALAEHKGWTVVGEYVDNSISASDKSKKRPGYDALVKAYGAGDFDALICYDLDRLTRQPRQLEDWIDAAAERGLQLVTANGEADLTTDGGQMFARIKAAVARAEVDRKSARQKRAALQRSENGKPPSGVRLTGYENDGTVVPAEAELVASIFARFLSGDSLRGITAWLNESGTASRSGRPWNPSSIRTILTNPRYAGRAVYQGAENGHAGAWVAIVDEATYATVAAKISDPRRRTQVGTDRKYLGSGLFLCGVCDHPVRSHSESRYRCPEGGHITRMSASIDGYVLAVLRARLGLPDLTDALVVPDRPEAVNAGAVVSDLRGRLVQVESDYDAGLIDGRRFQVASEKLRAQLVLAENKQVRSLVGTGAAATLGAPDPVAAFDAAPLGAQRAVLDYFLTVRLDPARRGVKFDPSTVRIEWRKS